MTSRPSQRHRIGKWAEPTRTSRVLCGFLATLQLLLPTLAAALPTDGQVAAGQATIQQAAPKSLTIQQTTEKAILNWKSFSIAADEAVRFAQPSVHSIALNRVVGVDPSIILGHLEANGRLFLINPNGILFGTGSQINVGGLLATTLQMRDEDFMAGRYLFAQDPLKGLKSVVNRGAIHVSEHGFVILAAPAVSNEGIIVANLGTTLLGSGQKLTLDLMGDGLIQYALSEKVLDKVMGPDGQPVSSAISNSGTIQAAGGQVILQAKASGDVFSSVVNQSGVVRARTLMNHDGIVRLDGGDSGLVQIAGTVDASGLSTGQRGGQVSILGERVALQDHARIAVSGDAGGGTALVGGNYQGRGPETNATSTSIAAGASINADAITEGDGGKVIAWADGHTSYTGNISARGGQSGGNGGFVEVSGKNTLDFTGRVDTSAAAGKTGTLLLDPSDITISTAANSNISAASPFTGTAATSNLNVTTLQNALGINNVIVDTTSPFASAGNITVSNPVNWASANSLELRAHNNITVNAGISATGLGVLRMIGNQDGLGGGNVAVNAAISARLGGIELSGVNITSNAAGTITTTGLANGNAGNVTIMATGAVGLTGAVAANGGTAGAGTPGRAGGIVSITGATGVVTGAITANGSNGNGAGQAGGNAGTITITNSTSGNLVTGALTARTGNAVGTGAGGTAGSITITQTNAAAGAFLQTGAINTVGGSNGNGGAVNLSSQSAVQFTAGSTIQATGGGALVGTVGRNGGTISISGRTVTTTGALTVSGSNGNGANQAGGHAGNISITSNGALTTTAGALTASGGNAGGGNAAGGNGGTITIANNSLTTGNVTMGALTARTGNATGTGAGGAAGSLVITQSNATAGATLQTAAINTSGGTKGAGGAVTLNSASNVNVTSTITTSGGAQVAGGTHAGAMAGNVTITGVNRTVTGAVTATGGNAVGANQAGGNAGIVSSTGTGTSTTTGGITARTGAATGIGAGGAAGSVTVTGTTISSGAVNTSGQANGNGGNVSVTSTTGTTTFTGAITTSGGAANAGTTGRTAGSVDVTSAGTINATTITANGSNGNGAGQAGGTGANVNVSSSGGNVTVGAVSTIGGSGLAGNASGGNGGAVVLDAGGVSPAITHTAITTTGGNRSGSGMAGNGGAVTIADAALLSADTTITASGGTGGGAGGNVTYAGTVNSSGANRTLTVNTNGTTTFGGAVGGTLALSSLVTDVAGTVRIGGNVTTTGVQTYRDPLTLLGNSTMTGTTPTFGSTVAGGGFNLTLNFSGTTTINGANFTGINNFASGNGGTTQLTGAFSTAGSQTYTDAVSLTGATTLTSSGNQNVTFNNTVNGAQALVVNTSGITTFGGLVGNTTPLSSLTTNAGGTTAINGGSVRTSGNQTYNDNVTMNQSTTLTSTGGTLRFGGSAMNNAAGAAITADAPTINLSGGITVATTGNGPINFFTNTLNPNGASINVGTGAFALSPNTLTNTIEFGDVNTTRVTNVYYGSNFGSVTAGRFTIGRPTHSGNIFVTGVAAAPSSINIVNGGTGSVIFENAPYVSGNQDLGVVAGSGGMNISSNLALGTGTLRLTTTGAIAQTAGAIAANTIGLSAGTGVTLAQPTNNVTTLAARTTAGDITFADTNGFTIGTVGATPDGFHPAMSGLAASAGTITLQSGGAVTQTQRILASALSLQGSGPYTLTNGANDVSTLTANTTGSVQYTDANALILGASNVSGNFDITTGGALTQSSVVTVIGATTLAAPANDITLTNAGNNFNSVGVTSGNNAALTDVNAMTLNASSVSGNFSANAADLTVGGAVASAGGGLNLGGTNSVTQLANLTVSGANAVTVTTAGGPITMAAGAASSSGSGAITYTAGTDVTLGSLTTGGGINVIANGGSVLSAAGSGTNVTAGANSTLQAFNGVVGTQAAPITVNVNPGTLSIHATTAVAGISAFLTGTVLPSNVLSFLNVPPGTTCFNGCPLPPTGIGQLFGLASGVFGYLNRDIIVPPYYADPSGVTQMSQVTAQYVPTTVVAETPVTVDGNAQSVAREIPPCFPASACKPGATILTVPADEQDPELPAAK